MMKELHGQYVSCFDLIFIGLGGWLFGNVWAVMVAYGVLMALVISVRVIVSDAQRRKGDQ